DIHSPIRSAARSAMRGRTIFSSFLFLTSISRPDKIQNTNARARVHARAHMAKPRDSTPYTGLPQPGCRVGLTAPGSNIGATHAAALLPPVMPPAFASAIANVKRLAPTAFSGSASGEFPAQV